MARFLGRRGPKSRIQNFIAFKYVDEEAPRYVVNELDPLAEYADGQELVRIGLMEYFTIVSMPYHVMADEVSHSE